MVERSPEANPDDAAARLARRVLLVGWDGAEWGVIDPLLQSGRMPNLAKLIGRGVRGPLSARPPLISPVLWTSIATGKRPHKHGIVGYDEPRPHARGTKPMGPRTRSCKALWNILTQQNLRTHVIGWPATHPIEPINGVMVSDRHAAALCGAAEPPPAGDSVHPPQLRLRLDPLHLKVPDVDFTSLEQLVPKAAEIDQRTDPRLARCAAFLAETVTLHAAATWIIEQHQPWDFFAVCYGGIEQFSRAFMQYHPPRLPHVSERDFEISHAVVARACVFHDLMLGRLLELAGADTTVILMSDHGYAFDQRRPRPGAGAEAWRRSRGIVVLSGPGVRQSDTSLSGARLLDIAPSVLALLGVPIGLDMDGRPLWSILTGAAKSAHEVFSWDQIPGNSGEIPPESADEFELASEESIHHLLALGYAEPADPEAQGAADQAEVTNAVNLARALIEARQPQRAVEVLEPLARRELPLPMVQDALAEAYYRAGRTDDSRKLIEQILQRGGSAPLAHLALGSMELAAGRTTAALEHLQTAEEQSAFLPGLEAAMGRVYARMRRWDDAQRSFRRGVEHDPDDAAALDGLASTCLALGHPEAAAEHARAAIALDSSAAHPHYHLGLALLALGQTQPAADALHACLQADMNLLGAHRRLAELYATALYDPRRQRHHESRVQEILLMRRAQGRWDESEE